MKGSIRQRSAGTTLLAGVAASTLTWPLAHALATGTGGPASTTAHTVRPWPWCRLRMQSIGTIHRYPQTLRVSVNGSWPASGCVKESATVALLISR